MASEFEDLPDIHRVRPSFPVSLNRVGVRGIRKALVQEDESGKRNVLSARIDVFIDLGKAQKGAHLSRHNESINESVEEAVSASTADVELLCSLIAKKLLAKNAEASSAEVRLKADYSRQKETPATKFRVFENYTLIARSLARRENGGVRIRKLIGAKATGMTVCPCGQELAREWSRKRLGEEGFAAGDIEAVLKLLPIASHNQRSTGTLMVETDESERVEADDLIDIIEASMSAPAYEVLKRPDELQLILDSHSHPVFVEDSVRLMLKGLLSIYPNLKPDSLIIARQTSLESVHSHNAFAEKIVTFGELVEKGVE